MDKKFGPQIIEQIIELKKRGLHISEISSRFNISDSTVLKYSQHIPHPNRKSLIPLPNSAKELSVKKAEILGFLCSEGNDNNYLDNYIEYDKRRKKSYVRNMKKEWINFSNLDEDIQNRFLYLMNSVYNYPLKVYKKGSVYIKRKEVVKDLRKYTLFGSKRWVVPKYFFERKYMEPAKYFIRAYLDGDGTVDTKKRSVIIDSVNRTSLKELGKLLNVLGIKIKYFNYTSRSRIIIKDLEKYNNLIGFFHPKKKRKLKNLTKVFKGSNKNAVHLKARNFLPL